MTLSLGSSPELRALFLLTRPRLKSGCNPTGEGLAKEAMDAMQRWLTELGEIKQKQAKWSLGGGSLKFDGEVIGDGYYDKATLHVCPGGEDVYVLDTDGELWHATKHGGDKLVGTDYHGPGVTKVSVLPNGDSWLWDECDDELYYANRYGDRLIDGNYSGPFPPTRSPP